MVMVGVEVPLALMAAEAEAAEAEAEAAEAEAAEAEVASHLVRCSKWPMECIKLLRTLR